MMQFRAHLVDNLKQRLFKAEECSTLCASTKKNEKNEKQKKRREKKGGDDKKAFILFT